MAGCGHCEDPVKPGDEDSRSFRGKALGWLTAELLAYSKLVPIALPDITLFVPHVRDAMRNWRAEPAVAPVRDETELKKLPESEQAEWRKLWTDVAKLQERVAPPPGSK